MKKVIDGQVYKLTSSDNRKDFQILSFATNTSKGTTDREVIDMLIDRAKFSQRNFKRDENLQIIIKLTEALMWIERRDLIDY